MLKKNFYLVLLLIFISSGCSSNPTQTAIATDPQLEIAPTVQNTAIPTTDPLTTKVTNEFFASPHASEYSCENCHSASANSVGTDLVYTVNFNNQIQYMSGITEFCQLCHTETFFDDTINSSYELAHTGDQCTLCHDPHTTQASCSQSACHYSIRTTLYAQIEIPEYHPKSGDTGGHMCDSSGCHNLAKMVKEVPIYHQPTHKDVPCYVCHDQSNLRVTLDSNLTWITVYEEDNAPDQQQRVISHMIGKEVDCNKCHYPDNEWLLIELQGSN